MPYVSDGQVLTMVADVLKVQPADLPAFWAATIVPQANERAFATIQSELLRRGFTADQVDAWDRRVEVNRDLAIYYALRRGGAYAGYDEATVQSFDVRADLKTELLSVSGVWVKPVGDFPGLVATAGPSAYGGIFNWPTEETTGLGDTLRW